MRLRHCSDEQLVGYLDGELSPLSNKSVRKHLTACYRCRGRLKDLEAQAVSLAKAIEDDSFPGPGRIADALTRFAQWEERLAHLPEPPKLGLLVPRPFRSLAVAVVVAVVLTSLTILWFTRTSPSAREIITQAQKLNHATAGHPLHQTFRVELEQFRPQPDKRAGQLQVWSESDERRFASRLMRPAGVLQHAVWQPEPNRTYVYDSASDLGEAVEVESRAPAIDLLQLAEHGINLSQLEAGFMKWLAGRRWRPVSFASDLARFASREGVVLDVERRRSADGRPIYRLTARRTAAATTAEFVLDLDMETLRPLMQVIRFATRDRSFLLRLISEREIRPARLSRAVFEPEIPIRALEQARFEEPTPPSRQTEAVPGDETAVAESEMAAREIEVRYALHRSRACLGDPIQIARDEAGGLIVSGITSHPDRKQRLLGALSELGGADWLAVELKTVDEAVEIADIENATRPAKQAAAVSVGPAGDKLAIHDALADYFRRRPLSQGPENTAGMTDLSERIRAFATGAVSRSEAVLSDAWALGRLAEDYGGAQMQVLPAQSRWLFEVMVRDHVTALAAETRSARRFLAPVLEEVLSGYEPTGDSFPARRDAGTSGSLPWPDASLTLLEQLHSSHESVLALFAVGAPLPLDIPADGSPVERLREKPPQQVVRELLDTWFQVETRIDQIENDVRWGFFVDSSAASVEHRSSTTAKEVVSHE